MKHIKIVTLCAVSLIISGNIFSQNINWKSLDKEQRHIINVNAGADYGLTLGAGYGYQLRSTMPVVLNIEYVMPAGEKLTDDFKTRIGGYIRLCKIHNFQFSAKVQGVFRRYENSFATLTNFGSDMTGIAGYYRSRWFVAGEAGFDKAIVTHFKHTAAYKQNFPSVKDGWYQPATGGNFYYGLQTGFSFGRNDIYLKAGKVVSQDFATTPLLPFYLQLGYNIRLN
jgi:hypothetical protein